MTTARHIFLAGASRGVGREIAHCLAQNFQLTALLRSDTSRTELEVMGVQVVLGDALNLADLEQAMLELPPIQVAISTIGGVPKDEQRADYLGNKNLINAALKAGVERFILVSSIGSGSSAVALPPQALQTLGAVLVEKEQAEKHLIASGLCYTIIRPGGLKTEPATGNGVLTEDPRIAGTIHRADVARLVCQCILTDRANNKILSAVDRHMVYGQPQLAEFSLD